jgi:hypothetical protein
MLKLFTSSSLVLAIILSVVPATLAQHDNEHTAPPAPNSVKPQVKPSLQPSDGASVKIITPKNGQQIKGRSVPIEFALIKGKHGAHVHAYVDGQMMGMFTGTRGTLSGIRAGEHTLELRVGTADHKELEAIDRVSFVTQ